MFQKYLNDPKLTIVGRVRTAIEHPEKGTRSASCTTIKPRFDLDSVRRTIKFISSSLRAGAGINVHLDNLPPSTASLNGDVYFTADGQKVSDSMEEFDKVWNAPDEQAIPIDKAIYYAYESGYTNQDVYFDLSGLRPSGVKNDKGMVSSGPKSFQNLITAAYTCGAHPNVENWMKFLSTFNQEIRRGGVYKNGAITTTLPVWHDEAYLYITLPASETPWLKRGLLLPKDWIKLPYMPLAIQEVNKGTLWLEKALVKRNGKIHWLNHDSPLMDARLLSNVCREVLLDNQGTCDLSHVNLGMIDTGQELVEALCDLVQFLYALKMSKEQKSIYLEREFDNQIGVGLLGLSNLLARKKLKYTLFIDALKKTIRNSEDSTVYFMDKIAEQTSGYLDSEKSLAFWFVYAYKKAGLLAKNLDLERTFVIAPTANSSFNHKDLEGFTTSPEIVPPLKQMVERGSETTEVTYATYHPDTEIASDLEPSQLFELYEAFQNLMDMDGLAHSVSMNVYEPIDFNWLLRFSESPLRTTYYRMELNQDYTDKSDVLSCACAG